MTLANVLAISDVVTKYAKSHINSNSACCPEISMILYGDRGVKIVDIAYVIRRCPMIEEAIMYQLDGAIMEQKIQYSCPMTFDEIKKIVTNTGEIHSVEIFTSTGRSIVFTSTAYRLSLLSEECECNYPIKNSFAECVEGVMNYVRDVFLLQP